MASSHNTRPLVHRKAVGSSTDLEAGEISPSSRGASNEKPPESSSSRRALAANRTTSSDSHPAYTSFKQRLRGEGKNLPSTLQSFKNIILHSPLNVLFVFVPLSWIAHFVGEPTFSFKAQFALSFIAIIPLEKAFDWLGEELSLYTGREIGDLIEITLNNAVEVALGIFLLTRGRLRLLQTTLIGVVILHLLLLPGVSFLVGGVRIASQELHSVSTELNHSLLMLGVLGLGVPTAFFASLDRGSLSSLLGTDGIVATGEGVDGFRVIPLLSDERREDFLKMSRAMAIVLLLVYIGSRIYLHDPPGENNALTMHHSLPAAERARREEEESRDPRVTLPVGIIMVIVTVALMSVSAEWLVDSIEGLQEGNHGIQQEWFGLILLPLLSFAADGLLTVLYFMRKYLVRGPPSPVEFTRALAIDLSVQFVLFWIPFFILLAWWIRSPLTLLFDLFEVIVLIAACFVVNYVTADSKTNWVEGMVLCAFYFMIAVSVWFYPGQAETLAFVSPGSVPVNVAAIMGQGPPVHGE